MAFGFFDKTSNSFAGIDEKIGYFKLDLVKLILATSENDILEPIELEAINEEKHPGFYGEGSSLKTVGGVDHIKVPVDPSKIILKNNYQNVENSLLKFTLMKCDQARLPAGETCYETTDPEFINFWKNHNLAWFSMRNFVDYENVKLDDGENPV